MLIRIVGACGDHFCQVSINMKTSSIKIQKDTELPAIFRKKILDWYDRHRRVLPWRALPGQASNPYHVWLSEIMLQQTTVKAVIPYFLKFIDLWPDVHALAKADNDAVMNNWAGLGYYARARNLHKCAKVVSEEYGGVFPADEDLLKKLPGIGNYTSAAIASIAFNLPASVVDGNVERVMARYHAYEGILPKAKGGLKDFADDYADGFSNRPGDYAQGLMDLGATICTPKKPLCSLCPLSDACKAYGMTGDVEKYPVKAVKGEKQRRYGYVYWITNDDNQVLIQKRADSGLLGGMYGLPTSEWTVGKEGGSKPSHIEMPGGIKKKNISQSIEHVFTHFHLTLSLYSAHYNSDQLAQGYMWVSQGDLGSDVMFPTVFNKAYVLFK